MNVWHSIDIFCTKHHIDLYKDYLVPSLGVDKIIQAIALIYAIRTFSSSYKLSKINFTHQLANSHRDIWGKIINDERLQKINDKNATPADLTIEVRRCIIFLILNTKVAYEAYKADVYDYHEKGQINSGSFFNLPMTSAVWDEIKTNYADDFVNFIEEQRAKANGTFVPPLKFTDKIIIRLKAIKSFCKRCSWSTFQFAKVFLGNTKSLLLRMINKIRK